MDDVAFRLSPRRITSVTASMTTSTDSRLSEATKVEAGEVVSDASTSPSDGVEAARPVLPKRTKILLLLTFSVAQVSLTRSRSHNHRAKVDGTSF